MEKYLNNLSIKKIHWKLNHIKSKQIHQINANQGQFQTSNLQKTIAHLIK